MLIILSTSVFSQISIDYNRRIILYGDTLHGYETFSVGDFGEWRLVHDKEKRIILLDGIIDETLAENLQSLLLNYDSVKVDTITLIIRSLGGNVISGLSIHDAISYISSPVQTIGYAYCTSIAAVLLSSGKKGLRTANRNCQIMIHDCKAADASNEISARLAEIMCKDVYEILASRTGQPVEKIKADCLTDYWMTAQEAMKYGLIDSIIE
jgi:ATP-dependent Clp protease protease subunit